MLFRIGVNATAKMFLNRTKVQIIIIYIFIYTNERIHQVFR
jgi:hypothetical protein